MKKGVVLINTSRGAIIDEHALLDNLKSGCVGSAGLDVIHGEWDKDIYDHPLIKYVEKMITLSFLRTWRIYCRINYRC